VGHVAVSVALDPLADDIRERVELGIGVFLAIGQCFDFRVGALLKFCEYFNRLVQMLTGLKSLFSELLDQPCDTLQPVVHQHLRGQQMAKAIAELVESGLNLIEAFVGIGWFAHLTSF